MARVKHLVSSRTEGSIRPTISYYIANITTDKKRGYLVFQHTHTYYIIYKHTSLLVLLVEHKQHIDNT